MAAPLLNYANLFMAVPFLNYFDRSTAVTKSRGVEREAITSDVRFEHRRWTAICR
jgi:hypothetical protein